MSDGQKGPSRMLMKYLRGTTPRGTDRRAYGSRARGPREKKEKPSGVFLLIPDPKENAELPILVSERLSA